MRTHPRTLKTVAVGAVAALLGAGCAGCAGSLELTRTVHPSEAAAYPSLVARALVRDGERIDLPAGARVRGDRVELAAAATVTVELGADDVVLRDATGRISAVRFAPPAPQVAGSETRFVPGTAETTDATHVRGDIADVSVRATDWVEVRGRFGPGDALPGGGTIESSRWTGALVGGLTIFAIAYGPSAYVGSQSPTHQALLWPLAGPWLDLAALPACTPPQPPLAAAAESVGIDPCLGDTMMRVALVASGVAQGLGALLTVLGVPAHAELHGGSVALSVVPTGLGAAAVGSF